MKRVKTGKSLLCLVCSMTLLSLPMTVCAWEPNAKDRDAAINAGNFTAYSGQLTAWLKQKVPADPAQITKEKMIALLRDPVFVDALAERQFIGKVWDQPDLGGYVKADPKNRAFVAWVMSNGKIMDEVMLTRTPSEMYAKYDNSWSINAGVLENWKKIYYAYPESREGLYLRLAIATVLRPPGTGNVGAGMAKEQSTPLARFAHYLKAHKNKELVPSFNTLTAWELTHVVSSGASDKDLAWGREALTTWNPGYLKDENVVAMASQMQYQGSQIPYYTMSCLLAGGGKCGPRSSFGVFINQAFGIPAIGVAQPAHAAVAFRDKNGNWQVALGRGWNVSKLSDRGNMSGGEFLERVKERKTNAFAHVEHLRWLTGNLTDKAQIAAVMATTPAIADASKDAIVAFQPGRGAAAAAATKPLTKPEPPITVAPGVIHAEAEAFAYQGGLGGFGGPGVAAGDCYTGGKQVHFGALSQTAWLGYKINVPKTGIYELTARVAVINWGQRLYARSFGAMYPVKSATASDVYRQMTKDLGPQMAIDNNLGTRWAMNLGKEQGWIELDLGQPRSISKMIIDEHSWDRVSRFRVEYKAGNDWKMLFEGGDIGWECKKEFPPVTAQNVRLSTLDGKGPSGGPTIWEISVGDVFDGNGWINADWDPATAGCWQTTKPLEMRLVEGAQTIWLCAPSQRGLTMRWFELTPKGTSAQVHTVAPRKAP